jgi:hypothetical protein
MGTILKALRIQELGSFMVSIYYVATRDIMPQDRTSHIPPRIHVWNIRAIDDPRKNP